MTEGRREDFGLERSGITVSSLYVHAGYKSTALIYLGRSQGSPQPIATQETCQSVSER